ncbi:cytochrome c552 [Flavobacterium noncentrifugens]|uniref:Cytochrome c n=1 Tax=Flavobacterium noncentrifugens TaxID=1128970 RepID=A0A1G8T5V0_9FLAO|nr:c-type cytochrome [Flavobacterium noncentrifugens]GEP50098.1 cytochrome c552 [Flavobacterium noncentrifugens]SDJ36787.1 cytochrome c [Flavobacterium noncentrifugens]
MYKKLLFLIAIGLFFSCKSEEKKENLYPEAQTEKQTPEQLGQELFEGKGNCIACHQPDQKIIGPSLQEIAKTYKDKNASIVNFLKGNEEPIVDPSQFEVMKTNFTITKQMSEVELKALESYILSHLK